MDSSKDESVGVQAIETGGRILVALSELEHRPMLKTIAEKAGMPPPKAHRYLVSLARVGLVLRDEASGRYELGPVAIQLGLKALRQQDVVTVASPYLDQLCDQLGHSVFLAVWGHKGPTVVRTEASDDPVVIYTKAGSVMSMVRSATGRAFGAYLPARLTKHLIDHELAEPGCRPATRAELDMIFEEVRSRQLARTLGDYNPSIHALSAPLFDSRGTAVGAISTLGMPDRFDASWDGPVAAALKEAAASISQKLGHDAAS